MLAWAEEHAAKAGAARLRLDCVAGNGRLRRWYRDHGYVERGLVTFSPERSWHPACRLEKALIHTSEPQ